MYTTVKAVITQNVAEKAGNSVDVEVCNSLNVSGGLTQLTHIPLYGSISGTPTQFTTSGTLTSAQILSGVVNASGTYTLVTDTAANLISGLQLSPNQMTSFVLTHQGDGGLTISGGTGVSVSGGVTVSGALTRQVFLVATSTSNVAVLA